MRAYVRYGFTLIEVMVSILILGLGLIAVTRCLALSVVVNQQAQATAMATVIAQAELENMRKMSVANYKTNTMAPAVTAGQATSTTLTDGSTQYSETLLNIVQQASGVDERLPDAEIAALRNATMTINPDGKPFPSATSGSTEDKMNYFSTGDKTHLYKATVTITWTGTLGKSRSVTLSTFIFN